MRLTLVAVGRLGQSPEALLAKDYIERAGKLGRNLGLMPVELIEVVARKPGKAAEAEALNQAMEPNTHLIACDEHGENLTSVALAEMFARLNDAGERHLSLMIGGADGLDRERLKSAQTRLAFGAQTWPHALVRVMAAEQMYRAVSILARAPYHRA